MLSLPSITSPNGLKPSHSKQRTHNQSLHLCMKKSFVDMAYPRELPAIEGPNLSMNSSRPLPASTRFITSRQPLIIHRATAKPNVSIAPSKIFSRRSHHRKKEIGITISRAQSMQPGYPFTNQQSSHPRSCCTVTNFGNPMITAIRRYKKSAPSHMLIRSSPEFKRSAHRPASSLKKHKIGRRLTTISRNILWNLSRLETGSNSIEI